ncbi:hypothetical protein LPB41_03485 [Thalassospira sp. MA62]|nr:hypothetical protein [Thalassospira sp. MA62]
MKIGNGLRRVCAFGVLSLGGLLAACGSDPFGELPVPECPTAYLPKDTAKLVQFNGMDKDLTDVIVEAEFGGYDGDCGYDLDDKMLSVMISPIINAELGPAAQSRSASFQYFVALRDPDGNFVQKNVFDVSMQFDEDLNMARFRDEQVSLTIPLENVDFGPEYEIYLGFQLTADQLDYNRRFGTD